MNILITGAAAYLGGRLAVYIMVMALKNRFAGIYNVTGGAR